jgi:hypothetical protein
MKNAALALALLSSGCQKTITTECRSKYDNTISIRVIEYIQKECSTGSANIELIETTNCVIYKGPDTDYYSKVMHKYNVTCIESIYKIGEPE